MAGIKTVETNKTDNVGNVRFITPRKKEKWIFSKMRQIQI